MEKLYQLADKRSEKFGTYELLRSGDGYIGVDGWRSWMSANTGTNKPPGFGMGFVCPITDGISQMGRFYSGAAMVLYGNAPIVLAMAPEGEKPMKKDIVCFKLSHGESFKVKPGIWFSAYVSDLKTKERPFFFVSFDSTAEFNGAETI